MNFPQTLFFDTVAQLTSERWEESASCVIFNLSLWGIAARPILCKLAEGGTWFKKKHIGCECGGHMFPRQWGSKHCRISKKDFGSSVVLVSSWHLNMLHSRQEDITWDFSRMQNLLLYRGLGAFSGATCVISKPDLSQFQLVMRKRWQKIIRWSDLPFSLMLLSCI